MEICAFDAEHNLLGVFGIFGEVMVQQVKRVQLGLAVVDALYSLSVAVVRFSQALVNDLLRSRNLHPTPVLCARPRPQHRAAHRAMASSGLRAYQQLNWRQCRYDAAWHTHHAESDTPYIPADDLHVRFLLAAHAGRLVGSE